MRKLALASVAFFFAVSLTVAAEVVFVKWDKETKKLTVKDGDKETTYTVSDDVKFKRGEKDVPSDKAMPAFEKMKEGKSKFEITVKNDKLTEVKFKEGKKKDKN